MKKLYVGNLPSGLNEQDLSKLFSEAGISVASITLLRDRFSGQSRGFGFVEVRTDGEAELAIRSLNGQNFLGRNIVVSPARPPREGSGRSREGGGGRRW